MREKTMTLINRYCRVVGITEDKDKKELKNRWKYLSHKQKGKETKLMKERIIEGK